VNLVFGGHKPDSSASLQKYFCKEIKDGTGRISLILASVRNIYLNFTLVKTGPPWLFCHQVYYFYLLKNVPVNRPGTYNLMSACRVNTKTINDSRTPTTCG
jgi:hypothetical protein